MKNNKKYTGEWFLTRIKDNKIIAHDPDFMTVFEKSQKYPVKEVSIEQKLEHGTCFF